MSSFASKIVLGVLAISASLAHAGVVTQHGGRIVWNENPYEKTHPDGLTIAWDSSGAVEQFVYVHNEPVSMPDRRAIAYAQLAAKGKALAAINHLTQTQAAWSATVAAVDADLAVATAPGRRGAPAVVSNAMRIAMTKSLATLLLATPSPAATLRDTGFDENRALVWVAAGIAIDPGAPAAVVDSRVMTPQADNDLPAGPITPMAP